MIGSGINWGVGDGVSEHHPLVTRPHLGVRLHPRAMSGLCSWIAIWMRAPARRRPSRDV
jgi:hypothetical protein